MIIALDSGIGGASILKEVMENSFNNEFVYFADTMNSPYGNKSKKQIYEIVKKNVDYLSSKYKIDVLILACNTATSVCAEKFRKIYNFPIIGVEPPIKVAIDRGNKNILIIATKQTIKTNMTLKKYISQKNADVTIELLPLKKLAKIIDKNVEDLDVVIPYLKHKLKNGKYDSIVLGCTHYNFIKKQIKQLFPNAEIISCESGVARNVKRICSNLKSQNHKLEILLSKKNLSIQNFLDNYFCNDFSRNWNHPKTTLDSCLVDNVKKMVG